MYQVGQYFPKTAPQRPGRPGDSVHSLDLPCKKASEQARCVYEAKVSWGRGERTRELLQKGPQISNLSIIP